jgi:hypothetical protein
MCEHDTQVYDKGTEIAFGSDLTDRGPLSLKIIETIYKLVFLVIIVINYTVSFQVTRATTNGLETTVAK